MEILIYSIIWVYIADIIDIVDDNKERSSLIKSDLLSARQDSNPIPCSSMNSFDSIRLINAINAERKKRRLPKIPASNDMCTTALFKSLVQKVGTWIWCIKIAFQLTNISSKYKLLCFISSRHLESIVQPMIFLKKEWGKSWEWKNNSSGAYQSI